MIITEARKKRRVDGTRKKEMIRDERGRELKWREKRGRKRDRKIRAGGRKKRMMKYERGREGKRREEC